MLYSVCFNGLVLSCGFTHVCVQFACFYFEVFNLDQRKYPHLLTLHERWEIRADREHSQYKSGTCMKAAALQLEQQQDE